MDDSSVLDNRQQRVFTAAEIGNYVVCPEAWRLKFLERERFKKGGDTESAAQLRREWVEKQDLTSQLREYAKLAFYLLLLVTIVVFLLEFTREQFRDFDTPNAISSDAEHPLVRTASRITSIQGIPLEILLILLVLGLIIFIWDMLERHRKSVMRTAGLREGTVPIAVRGSSSLPSKQYYSPKLGLSSRPDALVVEDGFVIPVDRKPMGKKVRDRHIAQLLVHMRLVEESEGKSPPYGMLLLGTGPRTIRIKNSAERQRWLDTIIDEMHAIEGGIPAVPAPKYHKCRSCDVRSSCHFTAYHEQQKKSDTPSHHEEGDEEE